MSQYKLPETAAEIEIDEVDQEAEQQEMPDPVPQVAPTAEQRFPIASGSFPVILLPLPAEAAGIVVNLEQLMNLDADRCAGRDHLSASLTQTVEHEISQSRNGQERQQQVGELPEQAFDTVIDQRCCRDKQARLQQLQRPAESAQPGQGALQAGVDRGDQDQGEDGAHRESPDHGDGERRGDLGDVFHFPHGHRHHRHDGGDGGDQDRAQAGQPGHDQGALVAVAAPAQLPGVIDQDDAVVDHDAQQDQHPDQGAGIEDRMAGEDNGDQRSHRCQRDGEHDDQGIEQRFKHRGEDHKDQNERYRDEEIELAPVGFIVHYFDRQSGGELKIGD